MAQGGGTSCDLQRRVLNQMCTKSIRMIVLSGVLALQPTLGQKPDKPSSRTTSQPSDGKPTPLTPKELYKLLAPSVVVVETLDSQGAVIKFGSGVAVLLNEEDHRNEIDSRAQQSSIVTNKHVIEEGQAWRVRQGESVWPAVLSHIDPERDLCWLQVTGFKGPNVPLRASSTLSVGERVYAIGAPEGLELTLSEGLISGLRKYDEARLIQTTAAISPGSSGGGLFDFQGRLVGITTFYLKEGQNLNFALPAEWIKTLAARSISAEESRVGQSSSQALEWYELGWHAYDAGDFEKAAKAFREVVLLRPDNYMAWLCLGSTDYLLKQYDDAIRTLKESIRLKPGEPLAWSYLGLAYTGLTEHERSMSLNELAIGALRESLRLDLRTTSTSMPKRGATWVCSTTKENHTRKQ